MLETIQKFNSYMTINNRQFVSGDSLSIADLLYYYELTNLRYFKMNLAPYPWLAQWETRMETVP
jgi:glutathione S-transferase